MSRQVALEQDPEGLPDFTLPVSIVGQVIATLAVDIKAQSIGNIKVDIAAQSLQALNVNITGSSVTLNVNIAGSSATLNVNVTNSTLNVNVTNNTLNVNVTNSSLTVTVSNTVNVNVANSQLNVNVTNSILHVYVWNPKYPDGSPIPLAITIQSSSVTLDVNIKSSAATVNVNISAQSIVLSASIADAIAQLSHTMLLLKGNRVIASGSVAGSSCTLYTVPSGKTAYVIGFYYFAHNGSSTQEEMARIFLVSGSTSYLLLAVFIKPSDTVWDYVGTGIIKMNAGESLQLTADADVLLGVSAVIMEV